MADKQKIIAMIPARIGSTRLAKKNLALLDGKPLIYYAIQAAKESGVFAEIIINSEDAVFSKIAQRYGVGFYHRPKDLGSSSTKSDAVVYDFMQKNRGDITAWVNPTSPLQTGQEVREVIEYFCQEKLDSLITVREEQVHCLYNGIPLNFDLEEMFAKTQDLVPVERFVYSIMMWRNKVFQETYAKRGHSMLCGKVGYYPVSKPSSLIVKTEEDLCLIQHIMSGRKKNKRCRLEYDEAA
ncbi:MAG: hypothetical protein HQ596_07570 [Candidatus Saganbacteria bacterium]|nr:hypothetical protein [Candidatus Saganbacteria bacterium]